MNGLLRQYFPKGTDLNNLSLEQVRFVAAEMMDGPERCSAGRRWRSTLTSLQRPPDRAVSLRRMTKAVLRRLRRTRTLSWPIGFTMCSHHTSGVVPYTHTSAPIGASPLPQMKSMAGRVTRTHPWETG